MAVDDPERRTVSEVLECGNCGAVLLEADLFCGECGAPRPAPTSPSEPDSTEPATTEAEETIAELLRLASEPVDTPKSPQRRWQIGAISLSVLSVVLCLVGLAAFLVFGLTESDVASPEENWLYATFCCLLPIAGTGVLMGLAAVGIWLARLRRR